MSASGSNPFAVLADDEEMDLWEVSNVPVPVVLSQDQLMAAENSLLFPNAMNQLDEEQRSAATLRIAVLEQENRRWLATHIPERPEFSIVELTPFLDALRNTPIVVDDVATIEECLRAKHYPEHMIRATVRRYTSEHRLYKDDKGVRWANARKARRGGVTQVVLPAGWKPKLTEADARFIDEQNKARVDPKAAVNRRIVRGMPIQEIQYLARLKAERRRVPLGPWRPQFKYTTHRPPRPDRDLSHHAFMRWAHGECSRLADLMTTKTEYICGNHAAETLWYSRSFAGRKMDCVELLRKASFGIDDFAKKEVMPPPPLRYLTSVALVVHGTSVLTEPELYHFSYLFHKHKPVYRVAVEYLDTVRKGKPNLSLRAFVQSTIDRKINLTHPTVILSSADGNTVVHEGSVTDSKLSASAKVWYPSSYQGNASSSPFVVQHEVVLPEPESVVTVASDLLGSVAASTLERCTRTCVQFGSFFAAVYRARSISDLVIAVSQFVSGCDSAWHWVVSTVKQFSVSSYQNDEYMADMSFGSFVTSLGSSLFDAVAGAGIFVMIEGAMQEVRSYLVAPLQELISNTRVSLMREGGKTLAQALLAVITESLKRIKACWAQKSFAPLWGESWDPQLWCDHVDGVIANYTVITASAFAGPAMAQRMRDLRESNAIPKWMTHQMTLVEFCGVCKDIEEQGYKLLRYFGKDAAASRILSGRLASLRNFLAPLITQTASNGVRMTPFYLVQYGVGGAGKTLLQKLLVAALARRMGYSDPVAGTHNLALNENFQSGLNHHKWCVVADDIDHTVAPPAAGQLNHIELLTKLVNSEPFRVEESESSMKGMSFACPVIVPQQTNFPDSRVSEFTLAVDTWWRRISMYVEVSAKPEYGPNGTMDPALSAASDTYDMYNIDVRFVDYAQLALLRENRRHIPLTPPVRMTFPEMLRLFYEKFDAHMEREQAKLRRFQEWSGYCRVCFLPMSRECGHSDALLNTCLPDNFLGLETEPPTYQGRVGCCNKVRDVAIDTYLWSRGFTLKNMAERLCSPEFWTKTAFVAGAAGALMLAVGRIQRQGREGNAMDGAVPFNWFRADQTYTPGVPPSIFATTYSKEDLLKAIARSWVKVHGVARGHGLVVAHNSVLIPSHFLPAVGPVEITYGETPHVVEIDEFTRRFLPSCEVAFVKSGELPGLGGLKSFLWNVSDLQTSSFDEVELVFPDKTIQASWNRLEKTTAGICLAAGANTINGDCGGVYIARIGKSWRIVAMHFKQNANIIGVGAAAYGAVITTLDCERAALALATTFQGVYTSPFMLSKQGDAECTHFPPKSEVWAAVSCHGAEVYPFGTLVHPMTGMSMKTRLAKSVVAPHVEDLLEEWCGEKDYWRLPEFRGAMVDGKWTSPFTDAFRTQNKGRLDRATMWMALADYLSALVRTDREGYAELSEDQALSGVRGSYVHKVNMRTSVGPPFNVKKTVHVFVEPGNCYMSPEMWRIYDESAEAMAQGFIPAAVGLCVLKDEGLKPGKIPRVFTVYAHATNLQLKKKGLYKSFMRANMLVFESAVGINMTGVDATTLVRVIESFDPSLDNVFEADAVRLDKSFSGELFDFVCLVIYAMSYWIGVDPMGNYMLVQGLKHTRFCIKNDLFSVFWNGSGNDATVEINGITMSLGERYVYYRGKPLDEDFLIRFMEGFFTSPIPQEYTVPRPVRFDFRLDVVLFTYGDDQLMDAPRGLNPAFEEIWQNEIGITMTDASKTGRMRKKNLRDAQFLKRKFRYDNDLGRWVTPLDKKTMARMLSIKNDSTLTTPDNAAVSLTECLREAVYHGRELYDALRERFVTVAKDLGISRNGYLHLPEYEHYRKSILAGNFQTWVDRSEILKLTYDFSENERI